MADEYLLGEISRKKELAEALEFNAVSGSARDRPNRIAEANRQRQEAENLLEEWKSRNPNGVSVPFLCWLSGPLNRYECGDPRFGDDAQLLCRKFGRCMK